jgi:hypothetical protein
MGSNTPNEKNRAMLQGAVHEKNIEGIVDGVTVNASGHKDSLHRHYSLWTLCGLAMSVDSAWVAFGGILSVSVCKQ